MNPFWRRAVARAGSALKQASPWSEEDHLAATRLNDSVEDHWAVEPEPRFAPELVLSGLTVHALSEDAHSLAHPAPLVSTSETVLARVKAKPVQLRLQGLDAPDPQHTLAFDQAQPEVGPTFDWFAEEVPPAASPTPDIWSDTDLPVFDPNATVARAAADLFDARRSTRPATLAGLLARETSIPDAAGRSRVARIFEEALAEGRWPGLFKAWSRIASSVNCPRTVLLAFELRELWDDSPYMWRSRVAPGLPSRQHASNGQQMSWRRALAIAAVAPEQPAWRLLDEDMLGEWEAMIEPGPGFWSWAEFVEIAATGDESEAQVFAALARQGRAKGALHLQDYCERLDLREGSPRFRAGVGAVLDAEIAGFHHRLGYFGPDLRGIPGQRRPPTRDEVRQRAEDP